MAAFLITRFNGTSPIASMCALTTLLLLPVDAAEVVRRLTVNSLDCKAFVADLDVQMVPLICTILYLCSLLTPEGYVLALVMFPVLPPAKSILSYCSGGDNDVDVGVILGRIIPITAPMDSSNRT